VRLAVYTDYVYRREGDAVYAERAFAMFVARLAESFDRLVIAGRLAPEPGRWHYRLPDDVDYVPLPYYASLARAASGAPAMARSLRSFWRVLDDVDAAWILGPSPLALAFAALSALRGRTTVLGARQDLPEYARTRHPGRRGMHALAVALETLQRLAARRLPVIVVGPELARGYRAAPRVLQLAVSLVDDADIVSDADAAGRKYDGELRVLSVGRLETEKNPLLLADALARLRTHDDRWRLVVCGEGAMADPLAARLRELELDDHAELRGYVPVDDGLFDLYRGSHAFLHVSWTEGVPQVLFEAFAAGLPVVATAVGGVSETVGDAALLIPAGDPAAAAAALQRVARDKPLRTRLIRAGLEMARRHTTEAECGRVAQFIRAAAAQRGKRTARRRAFDECAPQGNAGRPLGL
jgi:glycosyltransferase involved in cell wall biosynthesis